MVEAYKEILRGPNRPKIAIVLGSGGIRPFAAVELFSFLEEAEIPIDLLVGCSGGAIASTLKSLGLTTAEMKHILQTFVRPEMFSKVNYRTILDMIGITVGGITENSSLLDPTLFKKAMYDLTGDRTFEDFTIKTIVQATDVLTGKGVILTSGSIVESIYASSAIIPFFPPILLNGSWLADGAFSAPLPILEAVTRDVDIIIAMDFGEKVAAQPETLMDYYSTFTSRCYQNINYLQNSLATDLHHYEIIFIPVHFDMVIPMWKTDALPTIYTKGKEAVDAVKSHIIEAIEYFPYRAVSDWEQL